MRQFIDSWTLSLLQSCTSVVAPFSDEDDRFCFFLEKTKRVERSSFQMAADRSSISRRIYDKLSAYCYKEVNCRWCCDYKKPAKPERTNNLNNIRIVVVALSFLGYSRINHQTVVIHLEETKRLKPSILILERNLTLLCPFYQHMFAITTYYYEQKYVSIKTFVKRGRDDKHNQN